MKIELEEIMDKAFKLAGIFAAICFALFIAVGLLWVVFKALQDMGAL